MEFENLFEPLEEALLSAYPSKTKLKRMMRRTFGDACLKEIGWDDSLQDCVDNVIEWAEEKSRDADLMRGAHRCNAENELLRQLCETFTQALLKEAGRENRTLLDLGSVETLTSLIMRLVQQGEVETIEKAGLASLPPGASDSDRHKYLADFQNPDLLPLFRIYGFLKLALSEFPKTPQGEPTLLQFIQELREQLDETSPVKAPLLEWIAKTTGIARPQPTQRRQSRRSQWSGCLEVSLMVTVRPSTKNKKSGEAKDPSCRVNAYLFFDQISDRAQPCLEPKALQELFLPEFSEQAEPCVTCPWSKISEYVDQFLNVAVERLSRSVQQELQYRNYKLTLELFLPTKHMGLNVDQWLRGPDAARPIGVDYGVVVRFVDRIDDLERKNALFDTWDNLQDQLGPPHNLTTIEQHVEAPKCLSEYESWNQLEANLRQKLKLGFKLACGLPETEQEQEGLFKAVLLSDTPVAVWTRCMDWVEAGTDLQTGEKSSQTVNISDDLNHFLDADCIGLPVVVAERLKALRNKAWGAPSAQKGCCLGDHMAFLLDNPDRLPVPPLLVS